MGPLSIEPLRPPAPPIFSRPKVVEMGRGRQGKTNEWLQGGSKNQRQTKQENELYFFWGGVGNQFNFFRD